MTTARIKDNVKFEKSIEMLDEILSRKNHILIREELVMTTTWKQQVQVK